MFNIYERLFITRSSCLERTFKICVVESKLQVYAVQRHIRKLNNYKFDTLIDSFLPNISKRPTSKALTLALKVYSNLVNKKAQIKQKEYLNSVLFYQLNNNVRQWLLIWTKMTPIVWFHAQISKMLKFWPEKVSISCFLSLFLLMANAL